MPLIDVLLLVGATWRLSALLAYEDGPGRVFARVRERLGVAYDPHGLPYGTNWLAKGVVCPWCNSVWFGAFWAVAYWLLPGVVWLALPLALSAGAIIVQELVDGGTSP